MSLTVWLAGRTLDYPKVGGHFWFHLNWALGLRALGCRVIWLEPVAPSTPAHEVKASVAALKSRLEPYELAESVALCSWTDEPLSSVPAEACLEVETASEADLLLNMAHGIPPGVVGRFRRSAFLDTDPGLTQFWISKGYIRVARHNVYFTIGETVGRPGARFSDCGLEWYYTPFCVALNWWPPRRVTGDAPFTTVSNWQMNEWMKDGGGWYSNDKRSGFLPFLDLPSRTTQPLELALCLAGRDEERVALEKMGWRVCEAHEIASSPRDYQCYIQGSRGEISCAKPSYVRLQTAWISDRTLSYLASGKPAVVQHTGPSRFLPDSAGLFRFRDVEEAAHCLETVAADYERQCGLARALVEEYFDARKVVGRVLERALA